MSWLLMMSQPQGAEQSPFAMVVPIALIIVVFYFFLIRPQQRRVKDHRTMLDALKAGDSVVTIGGLRGRVAAIDDDKIVLRVADNVKLTFNRNAVAGILQE